MLITFALADLGNSPKSPRYTIDEKFRIFSKAQSVLILVGSLRRNLDILSRSVSL
jgi:hypothetical protein